MKYCIEVLVSQSRRIYNKIVQLGKANLIIQVTYFMYNCLPHGLQIFFFILCPDSNPKGETVSAQETHKKKGKTHWSLTLITVPLPRASVQFLSLYPCQHTRKKKILGISWHLFIFFQAACVTFGAVFAFPL
jgi:hypothetical protein